MYTSPSPHGTAVVVRVSVVLRTLSLHEPHGASTTAIARETGFSRPTCHRLLSTLADQGLVDRDQKSGQWLLGPELYLLGSTAASRYDVTHHADGILRHLSEATGESAFLTARRGDETVCLAGREGSFPLRSHVLHEGIRFPLGVASAGLAILAHLPEPEADRYLSSTTIDDQWRDAHSTSQLRSRVHETRQNGYATNPGLIVPGSWGMAAAAFDSEGRPAWALSLTGVESRFGDDRRPGLGSLLLEAAHTLAKLVARS